MITLKEFNQHYGFILDLGHRGDFDNVVKSAHFLLGGINEDHPYHQAMLGKLHLNLYFAYMMLQRFKNAAYHHQMAAPYLIQQLAGQPDHPDLAKFQFHGGLIAEGNGDHAKAIEYYSTVLNTNHTELQMSVNLRVDNIWREANQLFTQSLMYLQDEAAGFIDPIEEQKISLISPEYDSLTPSFPTESVASLLTFSSSPWMSSSSYQSATELLDPLFEGLNNLVDQGTAEDHEVFVEQGPPRYTNTPPG